MINSEIQAVLFKNTTTENARKWLSKKKLKPIKRVHKTKNYYRYRINNPKKYKRMRFKKINENISFIIGFY